jgi:hypothetical protein
MTPIVRMTLVVTFSVAGFILAKPDVALAKPCCSHQFTYYSDCNYTTVIGFESLDCDGHIVQWGNRSGTHIHAQQQGCENSSCCVPPGCDYYCQPGDAYYC